MKALLPSMSVGLLLGVSLAASAGPAMKDGMWEISMQSKMEGMPMQPPPQTFRHCYSARDVSDTRKMVEQQNSRDGKCVLTDFKESGNTVNYSMKCDTPEGQTFATGTSTHQGDSYTSNMKIRMKMQGRDMEMTQIQNGKRVGACQAG